MPTPMFGGTPDPISILAGVLGTPQGRQAATDIAGTLAMPAKRVAAMFGYMPEGYRYQTPQEADQWMRDQALGFVGSVGPKFRLSRRGDRAIQADVGDRNAGTINLAGDHPYVSSVFVEPEFRRLGIGRALYDEAEKLQGRKLVPSPLGLSDDAKRIWQKRLAAMSPDEAQSLISEAWNIGRSYGIRDEHIATRLNDLLPAPMFGKKP